MALLPIEDSTPALDHIQDVAQCQVLASPKDGPPELAVYREAMMVIFFNTFPSGLQSYKVSSASSYFRLVFRFHYFGSYFALLLGLLIFFIGVRLVKRVN